jgi:hypothetical protein
MNKLSTLPQMLVSALKVKRHKQDGIKTAEIARRLGIRYQADPRGLAAEARVKLEWPPRLALANRASVSASTSLFTVRDGPQLRTFSL